MLAAGNYSVTLNSGALAFNDGDPLDGNNDGTPGDAYTTNFTAGAAGSVTVGIADFMRGPGQTVNLPANGAGLPIVLNNQDNATVTSVRFTLDYDPALLHITGVSMADGVSGTLSSTIDLVNGLVQVDISNTALAKGKLSLIKLTADVPANAPYGAKQILNISDLVVNNGALSATDDDGLHLVGYFGDTSGDGKYSKELVPVLNKAEDILKLQNVITKVDTGFSAYATVDPVIVADISGDGKLSAVDVARLQTMINNGSDPAIPAIPVGILSLPASSPEPKVWIAGDSTVVAGEKVIVPIKLDTAAGLGSVKIRLVYDVNALTVVTIRRGDLTSDFGWYLDKSQPGVIDIEMTRFERMTGGTGDLLLIEFLVNSTARGNVLLDLTEVSLNQGRLSLNTSPRSGLDVTDAYLNVQAPIIPEQAQVYDIPVIIDLDSQWNPSWSSAGGLLDSNKASSKKKVTAAPSTHWQYDFLADQTDSQEVSPNAGIRVELLK